MDKEKLTVLLISKGNSKVRSFEIDSKYVLNYKKYLRNAGLLLSAVAVIFVSMFAYSLKLNLDNSDLRGEVANFNRQMEFYDSIKLKEKLITIDNNLAMIDNYLQSRGIFGDNNIGGELVKKEESNTETLNSLEVQSVVFSTLLRNIPMGYPHNGELSSNYGYRRNPFGGLSGEFHPGIDIKGDYGEPIYATADGVVNRCDYYGGYGNAVVLIHSHGYQTLYGHMMKVNVEEGQEVKSGDLIGFMGSTGRSTGPHVHYEIRKDGIDIDPIPYLKLN